MEKATRSWIVSTCGPGKNDAKELNLMPFTGSASLIGKSSRTALSGGANSCFVFRCVLHTTSVKFRFFLRIVRIGKMHGSSPDEDLVKVHTERS